MDTQHYFQYIPNAFAISVKGRDSARYLQARLSNDIRLLDNQPSILAAALNHQGRALALFTIKKFGDDFMLIADGGEKEEVLSALLQFKVADQLEAQVESFLVAHTTSSFNDERYILIPEPENAPKRAGQTGSYILFQEDHKSELESALTNEPATLLLSLIHI